MASDDELLEVVEELEKRKQWDNRFKSVKKCNSVSDNKISLNNPFPQNNSNSNDNINLKINFYRLLIKIHNLKSLLCYRNI